MINKCNADCRFDRRLCADALFAAASILFLCNSARSEWQARSPKATDAKEQKIAIAQTRMIGEWSIGMSTAHKVLAKGENTAPFR